MGFMKKLGKGFKDIGKDIGSGIKNTQKFAAEQKKKNKQRDLLKHKTEMSHLKREGEKLKAQVQVAKSRSALEKLEPQKKEEKKKPGFQDRKSVV